MRITNSPRIWRKASRSQNSTECVEVALGAVVGVRDTKDRAGGQLAVTATSWTALVGNLK